MPITLLGILVAVTLWAIWECAAATRSPYRRVRPGASNALLTDLNAAGDLRSTALGVDILQATSSDPTAATAGDITSADPRADRRPEAAWGNAALAGGLAAGVGVADWLTVDHTVLDAVQHLTHGDIDHGLDLWTTFADRNYQLADPGFETMLRGHVAEQEVFTQLNTWAGDDLSVPDASNFPGSDLNLGGHEFNVKVGDNASTIAEHLRTHPDIPVIVNADMAGLPPDALHVDLSAPIDPDILAGHSVVVADGLSLSDLHDNLADAIGPTLDSYDAGDLLDSAGDLAVPVLGTVIRVIRSGIREQRLTAHHGSNSRAVKNVATDVTMIGAGVATGGLVGTGIGFLIDVGSMGATAGLGTTVIGPLIGSFLGGLTGSKAAATQRMQPLHKARTAASEAVTHYDAIATEALEAATQEWTTQIVPAAERDLAATASLLTARIDAALEHARDELAASTADLQAATADALTAHLQTSHPGSRRSLTTRWLCRRWRAASTSALTDGDLATQLDSLCAVKGGTHTAGRLISETSARRARIVAAAAEAARRADVITRTVKAQTLAALAEERARLSLQVQQQAHPAAMTVWDAGQRVRDELIATGAKPPEWVAEQLPPIPQPTHPERP